MPKAPKPLKVKTGRPPKKVADKKTEFVKVLLTRSERASFQAAAERAHDTVSGWLRRVGLDAAQKTEPTSEPKPK